MELLHSNVEVALFAFQRVFLQLGHRLLPVHDLLEDLVVLLLLDLKPLRVRYSRAFWLERLGVVVQVHFSHDQVDRPSVSIVKLDAVQLHRLSLELRLAINDLFELLPVGFLGSLVLGISVFTLHEHIDVVSQTSHLLPVDLHVQVFGHALRNVFARNILDAWIRIAKNLLIQMLQPLEIVLYNSISLELVQPVLHKELAELVLFVDGLLGLLHVLLLHVLEVEEVVLAKAVVVLLHIAHHVHLLAVERRSFHEQLVH